VELCVKNVKDASLMLCYAPPRDRQRCLVTMFALSQPSWRDKFDENGKSREDPWWASPDDPTADAFWLSKYNF
jgi:hypothetical protein